VSSIIPALSTWWSSNQTKPDVTTKLLYSQTKLWRHYKVTAVWCHPSSSPFPRCQDGGTTKLNQKSEHSSYISKPNSDVTAKRLYSQTKLWRHNKVTVVCCPPLCRLRHVVVKMEFQPDLSDVSTLLLYSQTKLWHYITAARCPPRGQYGAPIKQNLTSEHSFKAKPNSDVTTKLQRFGVINLVASATPRGQDGVPSKQNMTSHDNKLKTATACCVNCTLYRQFNFKIMCTGQVCEQLNMWHIATSGFNPQTRTVNEDSQCKWNEK
jgi:hypothetical protein